MLNLNPHFQKLTAGYLFPEIARRVRVFSEAHPEADVIKLGIGDVTEPLPPAIVEAMHRAVDELASAESFRGYGPTEGYAFLREAIAEHEYGALGCKIDPDEIFVSDGSKCDSANILTILGAGNRVAVCDPVYPVYVDTNVMAGNTGEATDAGYDGLHYMPMTPANGFAPDLPGEGDPALDVIYLCSPNNPTGAVLTKDQLAAWVEYANRHGSLILFDAAYAGFIRDDALPRSIFEIQGAETCAIEFRSFSKNAGFTGTRCAFTVVPKAMTRTIEGHGEVSVHALWTRRQNTMYNGVPYIVQRGAEAVYSEAGATQCNDLVAGYMKNADAMRAALKGMGLTVFGGEHAPYVWVQCPEGLDSWGFFDLLLNKANVVGTPGAGFGSAGEGFLRLSAFNDPAKVAEAMQRIEHHVAQAV